MKGTVWNWFKSYLSDRYLKECILNYSVPQGNRDGPDLFVLYSSSLKTIIAENENIDVNAYADDNDFGSTFKQIFWVKVNWEVLLKLRIL